MALPLSPQVFTILRSVIEEHTGLHYGEGDRDLLAERLSARAEEAGFESLLDYYYFLRYDARGEAELAALVEHLVVQETYLFRELDQLRVLVSRIIQPRVAAGERVRIWSAACATGEEAISLAALLLEAGLLDGVELVASDISQRALEIARTGRCGRRSLRAIRPGQTHAWLTVQPDGSGLVAPELVSRISWRRVNLTDPTQITALGTFDVILCRNVLIYFADETICRVVENLGAALRRGGVLVVSVTESLLRFGTSLLSEEQGGVFFYRRAKQ